VFRNSTLAIIVVLALTTIIVTGAIAAVRGDQMILWDKTTRIYLGSSPANILVDMLLRSFTKSNTEFLILTFS
jgi:hypothetical protein